MHEVLVNRLGGLSLPRKSVVRLTDRPDMTLDVYRGRKTTMQQQQPLKFDCIFFLYFQIFEHQDALQVASAAGSGGWDNLKRGLWLYKRSGM